MMTFIVIDAGGLVQRMPNADESLNLLAGESLIKVPQKLLVPPRVNDTAKLAWLNDAFAWVDPRSLDELRAGAVSKTEEAIRAVEAAQARPLRELVVALISKSTVPDEATKRLALIAAAAIELRQIRSMLLSAKTPGEIEAIILPVFDIVDY